MLSKKYRKLYREQVRQAVATFSAGIDMVLFFGWSHGYFESFSRCCSAEIYIKRQDYYAGDPSCSCCKQVLLLDDIRYEWIAPKKWDSKTSMPCPWSMEPPQ